MATAIATPWLGHRRGHGQGHGQDHAMARPWPDHDHGMGQSTTMPGAGQCHGQCMARPWPIHNHTNARQWSRLGQFATQQHSVRSRRTYIPSNIVNGPGSVHKNLSSFLAVNSPDIEVMADIWQKVHNGLGMIHHPSAPFIKLYH